MIITSLAAFAFLSPQAPPTGLFIERAVVVQDTTLSPAADLHYVPPGPGPGPGGVVQFSEVYPDFARDLMLPPIGANVTFGGFSSGSARIPVDEVTGRASVDGDMVEWGFLLFVVGGIDRDSDPLYTAELETGADIWSYWHEGSAIADDYVGIVEKARDGADMGLGRISGMDHNLASLVLADDIADLAEEVTQTFYFTVDPATLDLYDLDAWFIPPTGTPSGIYVENPATILRVTRDGSSWTTPEPFLTYEDLNLASTDEITALAVDTEKHRVLMGTRTAGKQLWVATYDDVFTTPKYRNVYLDGDGDPFATTKLRLRTGNTVEAVCSGDPGDDLGSLTQLTDETLGMATESNSPRPPHEISISRSYDRATDTDYINIYLGNLRRIPGNGATALFHVNGVLSAVRFFNPIGPQVLLQRIPVSSTAVGPWYIQSEVRSQQIPGPLWSHRFEIYP